jgi:phosphate transport system substrate-binding protein
MVRRLPGAIGYVELAYALQNNINFGAIRNAAGNWVKASIEGVSGAAASVKDVPADYRVSITDAPGANAYPVSSFTWLLVPLRSPDPAKGRALKDLLAWIVTSGQSEAPALSYAPLPKPIVEKVLGTIASLR